MSIKFRELKQYLSRTARTSVCFEKTMHYDDYLLPSDIPNGKYDNLYIYGVGTIDAEFPRDTYAMPNEEGARPRGWSDISLACGLEIVVRDEPREFERRDAKALCFGDLRPYLQAFKNFSIVLKDEQWAHEEYVLRDSIPEKFDGLYVYGIGLANNPKEFSDPRYEGKADLLLNMRDGMQMEIVLAKTPRSNTAAGNTPHPH